MKKLFNFIVLLVYILAIYLLTYAFYAACILLFTELIIITLSIHIPVNIQYNLFKWGCVILTVLIFERLLATKKIKGNDFVSISLPYFKPKLSQKTTVKLRGVSLRTLYNSFLDGLESILKYKLNKTGKKIYIETHSSLIASILVKYGQAAGFNNKNDAKRYLDRIKQNPNTTNTFTFTHNDNEFKIDIKFKNEKILLEKVILDKHPIKYFFQNYQDLKVDNYKIVIERI